jgi:hypothetical protein
MKRHNYHGCMRYGVAIQSYSSIDDISLETNPPRFNPPTTPPLMAKLHMHVASRRCRRSREARPSVCSRALETTTTTLPARAAITGAPLALVAIDATEFKREPMSTGSWHASAGNIAVATAGQPFGIAPRKQRGRGAVLATQDRFGSSRCCSVGQDKSKRASSSCLDVEELSIKAWWWNKLSFSITLLIPGRTDNLLHADIIHVGRKLRFSFDWIRLTPMTRDCSRESIVDHLADWYPQRSPDHHHQTVDLPFRYLIWGRSVIRRVSVSTSLPQNVPSFLSRKFEPWGYLKIVILHRPEFARYGSDLSLSLFSSLTPILPFFIKAWMIVIPTKHSWRVKIFILSMMISLHYFSWKLYDVLTKQKIF